MGFLVSAVVNMKICNKCHITKELADFLPRKANCKLCRVEYNKNWYQQHKEYRIEYDRNRHQLNKKLRNKQAKNWRQSNKEHCIEYDRNHHQLNKEQRNTESRERTKSRKKRVIDKYGGKCAQCGQATFEFLVIDHINGNGRKESYPYFKLDKSEPMFDIYRVLCANCNFVDGKSRLRNKHKISKYSSDVENSVNKKCSTCQLIKPVSSFPPHHSQCGKCLNTKAVKRFNDFRLSVLTHYGGDPPQCKCCGESNIDRLQMDHINNDGNVHRKQMGSNGSKIYPWLVRHGFPDTPQMQVLCADCNHSKGAYGYCPHKAASVFTCCV